MKKKTVKALFKKKYGKTKAKISKATKPKLDVKYIVLEQQDYEEYDPPVLKGIFSDPAYAAQEIQDNCFDQEELARFTVYKGTLEKCELWGIPTEEFEVVIEK